MSPAYMHHQFAKLGLFEVLQHLKYSFYSKKRLIGYKDFDIIFIYSIKNVDYINRYKTELTIYQSI